MSLPQLEPREQPAVRDHSVTFGPRSEWSFTASSEPSDRDNALIVFRLSTASLGIDDLAREIADRSGRAEATRWQRARTEEYIVGLRDQLRLYLQNAEIIVHADERNDDPRLQVIATILSANAEEAARSEEEMADRVQAISKQVWINWSEGLRFTMKTLRDLEQA